MPKLNFPSDNPNATTKEQQEDAAEASEKQA